MKKNILVSLLILMMGSAISCTHTSDTDKATTSADADSLRMAIDNKNRDPENVKRDKFRNPYETLKFFEIEPDMTVVEVSPGKGWYTEILGPYLKENGKLYLAIFSDSATEYFKNANTALKEKVKSNPSDFGDVEFTTLQVPTEIGPVAPKGSADRVITFRNAHNWTKSGKGKDVFKDFYDALKPGGILGVVDHRAKPNTPKLESSGYIKQEDIIKLVESAGFKFVASSEINANPKDTTMHEAGVWTLPPSLRLGEKDKEKYVAIGESDRMTLKFVKEDKQKK